MKDTKVTHSTGGQSYSHSKVARIANSIKVKSQVTNDNRVNDTDPLKLTSKHHRIRSKSRYLALAIAINFHLFITPLGTLGQY